MLLMFQITTRCEDSSIANCQSHVRQWPEQVGLVAKKYSNSIIRLGTSCPTFHAIIIDSTAVRPSEAQNFMISIGMSAELPKLNLSR